VTRDETVGEIRLALSSALKLGLSLVCTWGIAILMRFWLPRHLGPERFGALSFADAFAATFFVVLGLGLDPYVRKEVTVRPDHASDFYGGISALRLVLSLAVVGTMILVLRATGRPVAVQRIVFLFAAAQLFVTNNATLSALLHAKGHVGGMSVLAVATKILWAAGAMLAIVLHAGLWALALAFLASEAIESVVLFALAGRHLRLRASIDAKATKAVIILCLPHFVNLFATTAYGKLDVTLLAITATNQEVGYYAAASAIASGALLLTPLIGWVMMPSLARAAARSHEELYGRVRRAAELVLGVAVPAALFVALGSDLAVKILFGAAFEPAGHALRILAFTFVITYAAMVLAITLIMLDRAWTLAVVSLAGLGVNLLLNLVLVPRTFARFGAGGGGVGAALALLGTEIFVTSLMLTRVGRGVVDRRNATVLVKSLAACGAVLLVDRVALPLGWWRLGVDAVVYLGVALATGALHIEEIAGVVKSALRARGARRAQGPADAQITTPAFVDDGLSHLSEHA
jgi:O-antigen/teichoic acid export membrane protein